MTIFSLFPRASQAFHHTSAYSKLLLVFTLSSGGVVAYSESRSDVGTPTGEVNQTEHRKKKVVVLGTGWAATSFLKNLDVSTYDIQVVSPRNYFAFTPLLPSVTCGTVEARSIVEPIRNIIKKKNGEIHFFEAECVKIDAANNKVFCKSQFDNSIGSEDFALEYDYLVVAVGAQVNTFNTPGVWENCHFLKELEDAQKLRRGVIDCFEKAVLPGLTEEERRTNLHFVVVGGGPTGVEFAAELHDFIQEDLMHLYPVVKDLVRITVIQSGDHILNMFDERIGSFAEQKFRRDGIDVQTGCRVVSVSDKEITVKVKSKNEVCSMPHGLVVWSTGISTRPVVKDLMEQLGQGNRRILTTNEWLRVKGSENVYAIGDCATIDQRKIMFNPAPSSVLPAEQSHLYLTCLILSAQNQILMEEEYDTLLRRSASDVDVSLFDDSVDNHFKAMDAIAHLCKEAGTDSLEETEVQRFSSSITFLKEWKHYTYEPRTVRFSHGTEAPLQNAVTEDLILPQFSSAAVPKEKEDLSGDPRLEKSRFCYACWRSGLGAGLVS